jgi:hypothetical protein
MTLSSLHKLEAKLMSLEVRTRRPFEILGMYFNNGSLWGEYKVSESSALSRNISQWPLSGLLSQFETKVKTFEFKSFRPSNWARLAM